jgi:adenosylcobyric acid synthase
MGRIAANGRAVFSLQPGDVQEGSMSPAGNVVGTLVHGLFDNPAIRRSTLEHLRRRREMAPRASSSSEWSRESAYARLADAARSHLDQSLLQKIMARAA